MMHVRPTLTAAVMMLLMAASVSLAAPAPAPSDTVWTLARCEQAALAISPTLARTRAQADAARAGVSVAEAGRLPILGLTGRGSYTTETMKLTVPSPTGSSNIEFGDGSNADLMLGLRAPLFTGGRLQAERESAQSAWQASLADVSGDSLNVRLQVRQAFFAALGGEAAANAARQGEERLRRHLADVESNLALGMATEEARLQVLARLRRTEQTTVQAQAEVAARRYHLGRLVGLAGKQIQPQADLGQSLLVDRVIERPWAERPTLQALDARLDAVGHSTRAVAGSRWPSLDLEGGWHYGRPGVDAISNDWMDYGTVAVNLRWTLFDFGSRRHRIGGLRAQQRALTATRDDVKDVLRTRQANALTQMQAAEKEVAQATERLDLENRRLEMAHERWREGHATESELLDAQDDVTFAAGDLATAQARLRLSEAELLAARGW